MSNSQAPQAAIVDRVYAAKGNSLAADELIRDYIPFIKSEACKAVGKIITESDDELSIAMIGFHEAVESYVKIRGAFLNYAAVVMRRRLIDYYRREKRHIGHISLHTPSGSDSEAELGDTLIEPTDEYSQMNTRDATLQEIAELTRQLSDFGLLLTDIADNCPKQERTLTSCQKALSFARENPKLISELKRTKKLPLAEIVLGSGVDRKTLERHRKYLMALMLIYSNGYEIIRGHLKQVLKPAKGGVIV